MSGEHSSRHSSSTTPADPGRSVLYGWPTRIPWACRLANELAVQLGPSGSLDWPRPVRCELDAVGAARLPVAIAEHPADPVGQVTRRVIRLEGERDLLDRGASVGVGDPVQVQ